jgi:hypothetical protein
MRSLLVLGLAVAALVPAPLVWGQEVCRELLLATEAQLERAELSIEGGMFHTQVIEPDARSSVEQDGFLLMQHRLLGESQSRDLLVQLDCEAGAVRTAANTTRVSDGETWVRLFEPPLPTVRFDLEPGQRWEWEGTMLFLHQDKVLRLPASGVGSVSMPESVETPAGTFDCLPTVFEFRVLGQGGDATRIRDESCWATSPFLLLVERRRSYPDQPERPVLHFVLESFSARQGDSTP